MPIDTPEEELAAVNAAIEVILTGGQEAQVGNARLVQARLDSLYKRKDQLTLRITRSAGGGIRMRGLTPT